MPHQFPTNDETSICLGGWSFLLARALVIGLVIPRRGWVVFGSLINRMILAELLKVFLLALTALTGLFLLAGLIQEAAQRGLSPGQVLLAIPLLIPNTLPYTIPATTLFATCVVYGRMAHDNEVLVL